MPEVRVCRLDELKSEEGRLVTSNGKEAALFKIGDGVYAVNNTCPHQGGPLSEGMIDGTQVVCPWHAWVFDVKTGKCPLAPNLSIDTYKVRIDGADVYIDL